MKSRFAKKSELGPVYSRSAVLPSYTPTANSLAGAIAGLVLAFGAVTGFGMDAPHTASCLDCHRNHVLFGNQIGSSFGNANECQSCHHPGGLAHGKPLAEGDQAAPWPGLPANAAGSGRSHRWDSSASGRVVAIGATPAWGLTSGGLYTGRYPKTYTVTISTDGDAGTALFYWVGSAPGGGSGTNLVTGTNVTVETGLTLTFPELAHQPARLSSGG